MFLFTRIRDFFRKLFDREPRFTVALPSHKPGDLLVMFVESKAEIETPPGWASVGENETIKTFHTAGNGLETTVTIKSGKASDMSTCIYSIPGADPGNLNVAFGWSKKSEG